VVFAPFAVEISIVIDCGRMPQRFAANVIKLSFLLGSPQDCPRAFSGASFHLICGRYDAFTKVIYVATYRALFMFITLNPGRRYTLAFAK